MIRQHPQKFILILIILIILFDSLLERSLIMIEIKIMSMIMRII